MRRWVIAAFVATSIGAGCSRNPQDQHGKTWSVDDAPFRTSARRWYGGEEEDRVISPLPGHPRHKLSDGAAIADNVLLFQKRNGGWPKNYDMRAILTGEQRRAVVASGDATNTTFDNGATYSHVEFLADAFLRTGDARYRDGCIRGVEFMLAAQNPNGGWPQFFPDTGGYRRYITFNDGAMIGVMSVLLRVARGDSLFSFVDSQRVQRSRAAVDRGVECILRCQVMQGGRPSAWCQQHDDLDFSPRGARTYEPAALASMESAGVVDFLMRLDRSGPDVATAIGHAVNWLDRSAIKGIRVEIVKAPEVRYQHHTSVEDVAVIADPDAPVVWARYYELGTNRPLFCNRDGRVVYSLAEVDRERRTGYAWYTKEPQAVVDMYRERAASGADG
ncbi:MAG: pectate lyase [Bacteroidetes bacterium]|nr:pectate lyase [Bacteroidota bacterium]